MAKYLVKLFNKRTRGTRYVKCPDEQSAQEKAKSYRRNPDYGVVVLKASGGR
jgi:hypothetical protein